MSEQPTATAPKPPAGSKAPGKKYGGLTRNQWLILGGVFVAALGYILWKRHQASAAAASSGTTSAGSNECTDANGNPVDCSELEASELASLANQLDQLQAQGYGSGGGSGGGGGYYTEPSGTSGSSGSASAPTTTTSTAAGTPTSTGGSTSTGTKTAAKTAGAITGLKSSAITKTSFKASWNPAANATEYSWIVRDLATHTQVQASTTKSTSVTVSGLKSGTDYNFGIQGIPGGAGDNIHVRTS